LEYISVSAAAKMLGLSRQRVYQLLDSGGLFGIWTGDTRMVSQASVLHRIEAEVAIEAMHAGGPVARMMALKTRRLGNE